MAKRVYLQFTRPEDLKLFDWMEKRRYSCRWDLPTFILASLHEAFDHQLPDDEPEPPKVENFERDLYYHGKATPEPEPMPETKEEPFPAKPVLSDEQLAQQAEAEIARLDAIAASAMGKRKRTGKIPLPPPV